MRISLIFLIFHIINLSNVLGQYDLFGPQQIIVDENNKSIFYGGYQNEFAYGDLNNDGRIDIISATNFSQQFGWFENFNNEGFLNFKAIDIDLEKINSLKSGDINNDGNIDIVFAFADSTIGYYRNDGLGNFQPKILISDNVYLVQHIDLLDMDSDGDLDVLSASSNDNKISWHENNGAGLFIEEHIISDESELAYFVYWGDLDGDGEEDIITVSDDLINWFKKDSLGNIQDTSIISSCWGCGSTGLSLTDIDNDGDLDIINTSRILGGQIMLYENNGLGQFENIIVTSHFFDPTIVIDDVDLDGFKDIIFSADTDFGRRDSTFGWYKNYGNNSFKIEYTFKQNNVLDQMFAIDINDDGLNDILGKSTDGIFLYEKNDDNSFQNVHEVTGVYSLFSPPSTSVADVDQDGKDDLLATLSGRGHVGWLKNVESGSLVPQEILFSYSNYPSSLVFEDLDNDGIKDFLITSYHYWPSGEKAYTMWVKNFGNGQFSELLKINEQYQANNALAADLDGDEIKDILFTTKNRVVGWQKNLGDGSFTEEVILSNQTRQESPLGASDLDGDGDLDILTTSNSPTNFLWLENDGKGNFGIPHIISSSLYSNVFTAEDLDLDGDIDLLVSKSPDIYLLENDGSGSFNARRIVENQGSVIKSIVCSDFDTDGDLDIVWAAPQQNRVSWIENYGDLRFGNEQIVTANAPNVYSVAVMDVNNDDLVDIVSAGYSGFAQTAWYENIGNEYKLKGRILRDSLEDCFLTEERSTLSNFVVSAENNETTQYAISNRLGDYYLSGEQSGEHKVNIHSQGNYWSSCIVDSVVYFNDSSILQVDFPIISASSCSELQIELDYTVLRRCRSNRHFVRYCNVGTVTAKDVYIEMELDSFMVLESASIPFEQLNGSKYRFNVANLSINECRVFDFNALVSCSAEFGQSHCTELNIYPIESCDNSVIDWDSSSVQIDAECIGDSVNFEIKNVGLVDMTNPKQYYVVEDNVICREGLFQLNAGESLQFKKNAIAVTYILKAEQVDGHPGLDNLIAITEGCQGEFTPSFANQFTLDDMNLFRDIDCQENIGSFDPNDKSATVIGYGDQHYINQNTPIEYRIRFQNVGNDTAFNVIIVDTLSEFLDPTSIVVGSSSHDYVIELSGAGILTFTFENILLPDSSANLNASNGFVTFKVNQKRDVKLGSIINNKAAIFFDFNDAVETNNVFHTVGKDFIPTSVSTETLESSGISPLSIYPNPSSGSFNLDFGEVSIFRHELSVQIFDLYGRQHLSQTLEGSHRKRFSVVLPSNTKSGFYVLKVKHNGKILEQRKLLVF